jgi:hypothetical protein
MAFAWYFRGIADQIHEPFKSVFSVPGLRSVPTGIYHQNAFMGKARAGGQHQAVADIFRKGRGMGHVEPELYGRCDLIHILPTWAGSSYKIDDDFFFRYLNSLCDSNHVLTL